MDKQRTEKRINTYVVLPCRCVDELCPVLVTSSQLLTNSVIVCRARGNYYLYTAGSSPYAVDGNTTTSS